MNNNALDSTTTRGGVARSVYADGGLLKFALTLDGVVTGAMGVAFLAGAPLLDDPLDWHEPTLAGQLVIAVQVVGCAGFAALQYLGLRRT